MKKSLLALAAMGAFAGAAQAQSSVTVYGVLDASYTSIEASQTAVGATTATTQKVRNTVNGDGALSTSRLGFRGVEDLGGGKSAQFVLEFDLINIGLGATGEGAAQASTAVSGASTSQVVVLALVILTSDSQTKGWAHYVLDVKKMRFMAVLLAIWPVALITH